MSAKFKTSVAMHCPTKVDHAKACEVLKALGFRETMLSYDWSEKRPYLLSKFYTDNAVYGTDSKPNKGDTAIPYNLDLFKALAAMREGEEFYPGELVRCITAYRPNLHINGIYEVNRRTDDGIYIKDDTGRTTDYWHTTRFQKLTVEEILAHFNVTPSTGDSGTFTPTGYTVNGEVPAVSLPAPKLPAFLLKTAENELEALRDLKKQNQHEIDTLHQTDRDFDARIEELQAFLNHYKA